MIISVRLSVLYILDFKKQGDLEFNYYYEPATMWLGLKQGPETAKASITCAEIGKTGKYFGIFFFTKKSFVINTVVPLAVKVFYLIFRLYSTVVM